MVSSGLLQAYAAIGLSAVLPIYFGSHASVKIPKKLKKALKAKAPASARQDDEDEDDDYEDIDRLTAQEAWLFPIFGSLTLMGLFLAFKYLNKDLINTILSSYFAIIGTAGLARMLVYIVKNNLAPATYSKLAKWRLELTKSDLPKSESHYFDLKFTNLHIGFFLLSMLLSAAHLYTNDWRLANFIALSFSFNAISLLKIDSFKTGMILLAGLFFYDIYWVFFSSKAFGQSVMVAVATNFEAPIKIVYPKDGFLKMADFTMLGLGDIVIPGIFVSLALRFDYARAVEKALATGKGVETIPKPKGRYAQPYFRAVMVSYVAGLAMTIIVMHTFRAAQPALLYLSPACILSVLTVALARGELGALWSYTEEDEEQEESKKVDSETTRVQPVQAEATGIESRNP